RLRFFAADPDNAAAIPWSQDIDQHAGREGVVQRVGYRDGLLALLFQHQTGEGVYALVGRGEPVVPGQLGRWVRAAELEGALVPGDDVAVGVHDGDGQAERDAGPD